MSDYIKIKLQEGPVREVGVNGCQIDAVVKFCLDAVIRYDKELPCPENTAVKYHLEQAIECLNDRRVDRVERGVEGTSND